MRGIDSGLWSGFTRVIGWGKNEGREKYVSDRRLKYVCSGERKE
jgi:hypothetical protein